MFCCGLHRCSDEVSSKRENQIAMSFRFMVLYLRAQEIEPECLPIVSDLSVGTLRCTTATSLSQSFVKRGINV